MAFPKEVLQGLKQEGFKRIPFSQYSSKGYYCVNYQKVIPDSLVRDKLKVQVSLVQNGASPSSWTYTYDLMITKNASGPGWEYSKRYPWDGSYDSYQQALAKACAELNISVEETNGS